MTPTQKLQSVGDQLILIQRGHHRYLDCPYCGTRVKKGTDFCCELLIKAVGAHLFAQDTQEQIDQAKRIEDKALVN